MKTLLFFKRVWGWIKFSLFYLEEVVRSNLFIVWDVLTFGDQSNPSIIALDLPDEMTDNQILLVSNMITMTPGTLCLDLTEDRKKLLVHILYSNDIEETRNYLTKSYVQRIIDLY